jgi:hypothetical protein
MAEEWRWTKQKTGITRRVSRSFFSFVFANFVCVCWCSVSVSSQIIALWWCVDYGRYFCYGHSLNEAETNEPSKTVGIIVSSRLT